MSLSRQASRQYLYSVLLYPLNFLAVIVTTHVLGPEGRGLLNTAYVIPNTLLIVTDLGMGVAVFYMLGRGKMREEEVGPALLSGGLLVGIVVGASIAAVYIAAPSVLQNDITGIQRFTVAAQIPFAVVGNYLSNILIWRGWFGRNFIVAVCSKLLNTGLTLGIALAVAAAAGVSPLDADTSLIVDWVCIALLCLSALTALGQAWFVRDLLWVRSKAASPVSSAPKPAAELAPALPPLRGFLKLLRFGWPQAMTLGAKYLLHYGDQYYLSRLLPDDEGKRQVGIYTLAVALLTVVQAIPRAIGITLFRPSMEAEDAESARMVALVAKRSAILTAVAAAALALAAPWAVWAVTWSHYSEFSEAVDALRILVIAAPMYALGDIASTTSVHKGAVIASLWPVAIACALNAWLDILWIPSDGPLHGMIGASWATVIAFAVLCILHVAVYWWYAGWENTKELLTPKVADVRFIVLKMKNLTVWMLRAARILRRPA